MTRSATLAHAARRARFLAERLPPEHRPNVAEAWGELLDEIDDLRDPRAIEAITDWLHEFEERCAITTLHLPLEDEAA